MTPSKTRPKTIFCDIDGCLLRHSGDMSSVILGAPELLPGVQEKFNEWDGNGYNIILTTGRKESSRAHTEQQLRNFGLFWNQLIMGIGGGERVLINDVKPYNPDVPTAIAINLKRDVGLGEVNI
mgnify:CR=1 FL=1